MKRYLLVLLILFLCSSSFAQSNSFTSKKAQLAQKKFDKRLNEIYERYLVLKAKREARIKKKKKRVKPFREPNYNDMVVRYWC